METLSGIPAELINECVGTYLTSTVRGSNCLDQVDFYDGIGDVFKKNDLGRRIFTC